MKTDRLKIENGARLAGQKSHTGWPVAKSGNSGSVTRSWIRDQSKSGSRLGSLQIRGLTNSSLLLEIFVTKQMYCSKTQKMQAKFVRHCISLGNTNPWFTVGGTGLCCPEVGLMTTEACAALVLAAMLKMQRNVAPDVGVLAVIGAVHAEAAKVTLVFISCHEVLLPEVGVRVLQEVHRRLC